jgi:hypothetical protein
MTAELLMMIGGIGAFVLTVYWVRSRELREKYAVIWLIVAFILLLCGLFPDLIKRTAEASRLGYASAVLFVALAAIYVFCFMVSVSLSRHYRRNIRLLQELALLEHRIRQLEERQKTDDAGATSR